MFVLDVALHRVLATDSGSVEYRFLAVLAAEGGGLETENGRKAGGEVHVQGGEHGGSFHRVLIIAHVFYATTRKRKAQVFTLSPPF